MATTTDTAAPARTDSGARPHGYKKALIFFNERAGGVTGADREKLADAVKAQGIEILLPGGTLNVLPRALLGELAWPEALEAALRDGVVRRLPTGKANGVPFFVGALFGSPAILARAREAVREGHFASAFNGVRHYMKRAFSHRLRAGCDGKRLRKAEAVAVLCGAFTGHVGDEGLEWVRFDARNTIDLARLSLKALSQAWREDKAVEIGACVHGEIYSTGVIPATLDGEPRTFLSSVRITHDANGPRVLVLEEKKA